ncbi:fasciclin domain-containing protein [Echinicola marina]|uniref:fasciclin domain-containing protein n=1 Tax=Echinicola marina TaxID=2859768 RepID=UPI001CF6CC1F|nr:fasciclin domain-containing protein [Echinicola marina]UCS94982.1 fasciclin domain-containing protein [Echinicola marina]
MIKRITYLFSACFLLFACREVGWEEHYERPEWLKGNAWELLEDRGGFSIFLEAVEIAGYRSLVEGKGIITVLAPSDEAFEAYLNEKGLSSVSELSAAELKKLVGFHLVYYAFNKERFANYRPEGQSVEKPAMAGLYYKHRTKSRDTVSVEQDMVAGKERTIFHKERFVPVFSHYLFISKDIDATSNYEYFYPESSWTGAGGFNISNASVEEYALPTDNGYVYIVDKVIEPLETVHAELKEKSNYSDFISIYDRFTSYWYDDETSKEYAEVGDSLYIKSHLGLPEIASEWSYNGGGGLQDYANLAALSSDAYNVFAPNNQAIQQFFNQFWVPYYSSLDEVPFLPLQVLLYNHVYSGSIVFPGEVERGDIKSTFGNIIQFDPVTDVEDRGIGVNGVYYGLNEVIVPGLFEGVTGPMLQNPKYNMFLHMVYGSGTLQALMGDALKFTVFAPSDEVILNTIYGGSEIFWNEGNPLKFGDEAVEVENSEGIRVPVSTGAMKAFVQNHIVTDEITEIAGTKVYRTRNPFSYLYISDDGVASSNTYNLGEFTAAENVGGNWTNGKVYEVDRSLIREEGSFKYIVASASSGTSSVQEFSEFSKLLSQADLVEPNKEFEFLFGDNYMLFAPTNEAILRAKEEGKIPTDKDELEDYLRYYFVPISPNSINDYAFPGMGVSGDFLTSQENGNSYGQLTLVDNGSSLQVKSTLGEMANVVSTFPKIYVDGAIYQIDKVLSSGQ